MSAKSFETICQTHADVPKDLLEKNGITDKLLRISVGIEGIEDLIGDFKRLLTQSYL